MKSTSTVLSVVSSLYKSENYLEKFIFLITKSASSISDDFEIILVDDGSPDNSLQVARELALLDRRIKIIELSRNFGHHNAFWCGLHYATGEYLFLIDLDLEVSPLCLSDFWRELHKTSSDVVYGVQRIRKGAFFSRILGGLFWKIFNIMSDVKVPENIMTERLLTRKYVISLLTMGDKNLFLAGMYSWPGFRQVPLPLTKKPRSEQSSYSILSRTKLLVRAVTSFSSVPLLAIFWMGFLTLIITLLYSFILIIGKLFLPIPSPDGFTFMAILTLMGFGITLLALGIISIYLHRLYTQVQARPTFVVRNFYQND